ncbi:hypothetical protein EJ05DRAFT_514522 [Pseudovirgaria hyperparasitica]|uniref:Uncharacterized protein n=1 Tax=Pseudovirgaria hyperparasitica TaxID=470096 RepID=A0A6A6VWM9_9PEZI|nr:uncharacterized protein EJ05DRAFT_514522 [Pseudovirgaria hyperparasitica]KAF2754050.1 hypothetical protein EJ05DRAFT_514522 [Pseudovirgaria hyperparasitica]
MDTSGLRDPFAIQGASSEPKGLGVSMSPSSNYGLTSPEIDGSGFQALDPRLTYSSFAPPTNVMINDVKNGLGDATSAAQRERARSSALLNVNDPVSLHLLVETAMGDSQDYEILSYEEVDTIKTELRDLQPRIEATSRKLAMESKVRDAAQSLGRLHKKQDAIQSSPKRNRRSMSNRSSTSGVKSNSEWKGDSELATSIKKCDNLSQELWHLESRCRLLQTQLLKHTAGILQMTHAGPTKKEAMRSPAVGTANNGRPDSPQSIYNYDTSRKKNSNQFEDTFDERSLYRSPENLDHLMLALKNGTHHTHIDEFNDGLASNQALVSVEQRLEDLNNRMRDLIVKANPDRNKDYASVPTRSVELQLDYLDKALGHIGAENNELQKRSRHSQSEVEGRLEEANNQLCSVINNLRSTDLDPYPPPPRISGRNMQEQITYLQEALFALEQATMSSQSGLGHDAAQYEATLSGLWSIILAGEEEARQRKRQRRQNIAANPGGFEREEDLSPDEDGNTDEAFTLQAFSAKVQWLYSRASNLKEQQSILRRQIRQQRELNNKTDAQTEENTGQLHARIEDLESELTHMRDDSRIEASEMQASLHEASERIEQLSADLRQATDDREAKDMELRDLEGEVVRLQTEVTIARADLDGAYGTRAQRAAEVASNPEIKRELEELKQNERVLKEELKGMAAEYEALTRDSIQNEKDRDGLEALIDSLRNEKERLELDLSDERVRWLGARSPGAGPTGIEMTSVRMMREDFKKMMREKTTEALKALRAEQEERRKLEALVRQLRKGSEPPKSGLSHSMTA